MDLGPSKFMPRFLLKYKLWSLITTDFITTLQFTDSKQKVNWDITRKFKFMEPEYINSLKLFCDYLWSHLRFLNSLWNSSASGFVSNHNSIISFRYPNCTCGPVICFLRSEVNATLCACFCLSFTHFSHMVQQQQESVAYSLGSDMQ
jgi:hypothetical protein